MALRVRRFSLAVGAVIAAFGVAACSGSTESPATPEPPTSGASATPTSTPTDTATPIAVPLDATRAVERALQVVPGVVVELGSDSESGRAVWEVGVLGADGSGTEVNLDQATGDVVRQSPLQLDPEQRSAPAISAARAITIAEETVPGSVLEMDLDTDRSVVVWEVLVAADAGDRFELYLDATTGAVVKQERDD